jgi:deferrochelatase/peroxidase EfeB
LIAQKHCPRVNGVADRKLQEGIYFRHAETPPGFFTFLLLSATPGATAVQIGYLLDKLWTLYQGLKAGMVPELPDQSVPKGGLEVLLGFGPAAFALAERPSGVAALPQPMGQAFAAPAQAGGGPISRNSGIHYESDVMVNPADASVAFQFTAETPLAVERAVVETWKLLQDEPSPALAIRAVYAGAARDDGRSWIDFYDGLSNIPSAERPGVIVIPSSGPPAQDEWTVGGTYLAFMRLYIDLAVWRTLSVRKQEELVGRQKLTGLPYITAGTTFGSPDAAGEPPREADITKLGEGTALDTTIGDSHIQRANHHNPHSPGGSANPMNHRIYRQGYPFLQPHASPKGFRVGLNFISFQWTPASLIGMLGQVGWLGNTNFGGDNVNPVVLVSATAAGTFLVPPWGDAPERFPGDRALTGG